MVRGFTNDKDTDSSSYLDKGIKTDETHEFERRLVFIFANQ
jgi:hypothetical protein